MKNRSTWSLSKIMVPLLCDLAWKTQLNQKLTRPKVSLLLLICGNPWKSLAIVPVKITEHSYSFSFQTFRAIYQCLSQLVFQNIEETFHIHTCSYTSSLIFYPTILRAGSNIHFDLQIHLHRLLTILTLNKFHAEEYIAFINYNLQFQNYTCHI